MKKIITKNVELVIKYDDLGKSLHSRTVIANMLSNARLNIRKLLGDDYSVVFTITDIINTNRKKFISGRYFNYVENSSDKHINSRLKNRGSDNILVEVKGITPITNSTNERNKSYVYGLINLISDDYKDLISLIKGE